MPFPTALAWVIASLGPYWTTRIITLDEAPLVRRGPFRLVRHPNYMIVAAEIAILPLAFGEWRIALVFSVLNAALLAWRIRIEERALAEAAASAAPCRRFVQPAVPQPRARRAPQGRRPPAR